MKEYSECPELETIAAEILSNHPTLDACEAKIKYLCFTANKSSYLGSCARATGRWKFLVNYDYVIDVFRTTWDVMTDKQKHALVLHELLHVLKKSIISAGAKSPWALRKHDIEEFDMVEQTYGLRWTTEAKDSE